MGEGST